MFELEPIRKIPTSCCSLVQFSICDYHDINYIKSFIKSQQKESDSRKWFGSGTASFGQKNIFVIVSPGEDNLRKNLIEIGFECISKNKMKRRTGYPPGTLEMWMFNLE